MASRHTNTSGLNTIVAPLLLDQVTVSWLQSYGSIFQQHCKIETVRSLTHEISRTKPFGTFPSPLWHNLAFS